MEQNVNRNNNNVTETRKKCIDQEKKFKIFDISQAIGFHQCTEAFQNIGEINQMTVSGLNNYGTNIETLVKKFGKVNAATAKNDDRINTIAPTYNELK